MNTVSIVCMADSHGNLPEIPDCQLCLIGGDIVPLYAHTPHVAACWMRTVLQPWLTDLKERGITVIAVAGNHDFIFERRPDLVPPLSWIYLQDSGTTQHGLKCWGTPWQPRYYDWAFNLDEPELATRWAEIPTDTDVLLLHGPPSGAGDSFPYDDRPLGSPSLRSRIEEIQPRLVVCGHIHGGYGSFQIGQTKVVNAALVNEQYQPVRPPTQLELAL